MDAWVALGLALLAAAYLVRRSVRTFRSPQDGACGGGDGCGKACASPAESAPVLVRVDLPGRR